MKKKYLSLKTFIAGLCLLGSTSEAWAQGVVLDWVAHIAGTGIEQGRSVVTDKNRNVISAGSFSDTIDLDPGTSVQRVVSSGFHDGYVSKLDPEGNLIWAKHFGGSNNEFVHAVVCDEAGNIYVTGDFVGTAEFNPGGPSVSLTATGTSEGYLCKFAPDGDLLWAHKLGGATGRAMTIDANAYLYITGYFEGMADFDPGAGTTVLSATGNADVFVSKFDSAGNFIRAVSFGGTEWDYGAAISTDHNGHIYLAGSFSGTADFNPGSGTDNLTATGWESTFISKLDTAGNFVWARVLDGDDYINAFGIAADTAGNVYTTGVFNEEGDFNPGSGTHTLTAESGEDVFIVKLNAAGDFVWAGRLGGEGDDRANAITLDAAGNVYTTGYFAGTADFDPGPGTHNLTSDNWSNDMFISKLTPDGDFIWVQHITGEGSEWSQSVHVDRSGHVYTTGNFSGTADFDPGTSTHNLSTNFNSDGFVHKLFCTDTTSATIQAQQCYSYTLHGHTFTQSGTYMVVIPNKAGCDSTITLQLTIPNPNPQISVNGDELSTIQSYTGYQWFRNDTVIDGATNRIYNVTANAAYRVAVVDNNGCADTSDAYEVTNVSVYDVQHIARQIQLYPNPASEVVHIAAPVPVRTTITGIQGNIVGTWNFVSTIPVENIPAGVYFMLLYDQEGQLLKKEKLIRK